MNLFVSGSISRLIFVTILGRSYKPSTFYACLLQLRHSVLLVVDDFLVLRTFSREGDPQHTRPSIVLAARLANGRPRDQWAPHVPSQLSPDCTELSGAPPYCPMCMELEVDNGRLHQIRKGIAHCSLSGAPSDRRQLEPSKWRSNGSFGPWGYKRGP
jgi:hypothetical protein